MAESDETLEEWKKKALSSFAGQTLKTLEGVKEACQDVGKITIIPNLKSDQPLAACLIETAREYLKENSDISAESSSSMTKSDITDSDIIDSDITDSDMTAQKWKEKGNEEFNKGNWSEALSYYTNALKLVKEDNAEKAVYYKNRAAAYLKLCKYEKVIEDCDSALKICSNDPKALFRRCQALEALERFEEAYQDAEMIILSGSFDKAIQPIAMRLREIIQELHKEDSYISAKVSELLNLAFNESTDEKQRETAVNNLLMLVREKAGAEIFKNEDVSKITELLKVEENEKVICNMIHIVGELCKNNISRTEYIMKDISLTWYLEMMNSTSTQRVNACRYCLQTILNTYSGMENKSDSKSDKVLCEAHKKEIDTFLSSLLYSITSRTITGLARDTIIELIMHNIHYTALNWAERLVELHGLQKLMEVAGETKEYKYESSMDITSSTRTITSMCLAKIYKNIYCDVTKEKFNNAIEEFIKDKLSSPDIESKVRAVVAITTLLLGPIDVGNAVMAKERTLEIILDMAESDDILQQKVACECIVAAAIKKDKANVIINQSVNILKKLYQSEDDSLRVLALIGLCKLSSSDDTTITLFADGATKKLVEICKRFLIDPEKEKNMKEWVIEGLLYLTFDVEVKEKLVEDQQVIRMIFELADTDNQSILNNVLIILVNLCNTYDEEELIPEMIELAKFAKYHISEEHKLDNDDLLNRRLCALANAGVTRALMSFAKTDSHNNKELIARVFNAICSQEEVRVIIVQQGGTTALLSLALDSADKVKRHASQALARLGNTVHPSTAFPDHIVMIIRLFINLLNPEYSVLENYESLIALCNVASINSECILEEGGFQKIVTYMYEDHIKLRRVAAQVINNLMMCDEVMQYFEQDNVRVKYLVRLCKDDDQDTSQAAAGILAMLTRSKKICEKFFDLKNWHEFLLFLLTNSNGNIKYKGIAIVINMMRSRKDIALKLIDKNDIMEILMILRSFKGKKQTMPYQEINSEMATTALQAAVKAKLFDENEFSQNTGPNVSTLCYVMYCKLLN